MIVVKYFKYNLIKYDLIVINLKDKFLRINRNNTLAKHKN